MCRARNPKPKYCIQQWFDDYNKENPGRVFKVLLLPVAHPLLNPIEMMWNQIKAFVRKWNFTYTMERVKELALAKKAEQGSVEWEKQYQRMVKYAILQWEADEILLADAVDEDAEEEEEEEDDGAHEMG